VSFSIIAMIFLQLYPNYLDLNFFIEQSV